LAGVLGSSGSATPPDNHRDLPARLPSEVLGWLQYVEKGSELVWRSVKGQHRMVLRCVASLGVDEWLISLETDPLLHATQTLSAHHGLSQREVEVLYWLACGKSNRDISDILGMQPRTVGKHLEHIFVKLGVESRAAATSFVLRISSQGTHENA
jgi:DNA-binding CsgD family transcriptional regulator